MLLFLILRNHAVKSIFLINFLNERKYIGSVQLHVLNSFNIINQRHINDRKYFDNLSKGIVCYVVNFVPRNVRYDKS